MFRKVNSIPSYLLAGFVSATRRLKVEVAETCFWEAREFRMDVEIDSNITVKFTSPINFILHSQTLESHDGAATLTAWRDVQGTESGSFSDDVSIFENNGMSDAPSYTRQVTALSGGSFTPDVGQVAREYIKVVTSTSTANRSSVGGTGVLERGLPAGTYYLVFTGDDASYHLTFEERP